MTPRLGINIDHVATLRQARKESYPSVQQAAEICLQNNADQITVHLREDRRHIQDEDIPLIRKVTRKFNRLFNLETSYHEDMVKTAMTSHPDWVCLVPENRQEMTTEGGVDLKDQTTFTQIKETCLRLKETGISLSLFLESDPLVLNLAMELPIDAVEIHTGEYSRIYGQGGDISGSLKAFSNARNMLNKKNISCHGGHGLTYDNLGPLLEHSLFEEYNIGHWVVSQGLFEGLGRVVNDLKQLLEKRGINESRQFKRNEEHRIHSG